MLVDPAEGVPPLVDAILNEIEINRLENFRNGRDDESADRRAETAIGRAIEYCRARADVRAESRRIRLRLTKIRPTMPSYRSTAAQARLALSRSLATVASGQDDVIATLERLVGELSGKADSRRLVRQIAELREDQLAHEKLARAEIGVATLPLEINELSRAQRANLNKAVAGENAIAGRFEKIEQGMDQLAAKLADEKDPNGRYVE